MTGWTRAAELRALLGACWADLDLVRRAEPTADGDAAEPAAGMDDVARLVDRLEHAAVLVEQALDVVPTPERADLLAREADHRIRNSLQIVSTLLQRQAGQSDLESVRDALAIAGARVTAIAEVHALLHVVPARDAGPVVDLRGYLEALCASLAQALALDGPVHRLQVDVRSLRVTPATAQQLGLIVTELVANAARHGIRRDRQGRIWVSGIERGNGSYQLCVEDDGQGLPPGFDIRHRPSGLGLRVVNLLADQARARLTADGRLGARFTLTLPAPPRC